MFGTSCNSERDELSIVLRGRERWTAQGTPGEREWNLKSGIGGTPGKHLEC